MAKKSRAFDHSKYQFWIRPEEVEPYEKNAKQHTEKQVKNIANSINRFGWQQDVVITSDNVLVIGHGRRLAALEIGCEMPYHRIDKAADELTDKDIRELRIADNQTNAETGLDFDMLNIEIEDLDFDGFDFDFGIDTEEQDEEPTEIVEDEPPTETETRCKVGDLWQLGSHRLICGDSTDVAVIDRLMDGVKADMVLTDPPYGTTNIVFDKESKVDFWDSIEISSRNNSAKLIFCQQPYTTRLILSNEKEFKYEIIWHKTHATGFLNAKKAPLRAHETICVFYKNQPTYNPQKTIIERNDIGRKKVNGTKAEQYNDYQVGTWEWEETGERYPTDVITFSSWNGARFGDTSNATVHPTQKPINLLSYLIKTYSNDNDIVLDLFGGSGSTLIACEQLNRKCYMC